MQNIPCAVVTGGTSVVSEDTDISPLFGQSVKRKEYILLTIYLVHILLCVNIDISKQYIPTPCFTVLIIIIFFIVVWVIIVVLFTIFFGVIIFTSTF